MKKAFLITFVLSVLSLPVLARDTVLHLPLSGVLAMPEAQGKLDGSVKFFLDGQKTPKVLKTMEEGVSNPKTNGLGKNEEFGCNYAALSALIKFQESAKQRGANAVINMVSYYKKEVVKNDTTFECHSGTFVVGVALKGTYAKIEDK